MNEKGAVYPYVLLFFIIIQAVIVWGTGIYLSRYQTSKELANYYETKVMETLALKKILANAPNIESGQKEYHYSAGKVEYTTKPYGDPKYVILQLTTNKRNGTSFTTSFLYNKHNGKIEKALN
ncbi:MAG: hypothetical protein IMW92_06495 [Bacillales bacterium]|nr:hypothetical protein [Bacillales bacterium]